MLYIQKWIIKRLLLLSSQDSTVYKCYPSVFRKMATPTMEAIYQTLSNNYNIIISQRGRLEELRGRLKRAKNYDITAAPWQQGVLPSPVHGK